MHVVMDVLVYDSAATTPFYEQQVDIKRQDDNYWYKFEQNEMLMTEKYLIMLDRNARQITCSKRSLETESQLANHFRFDIDSILSLYPSPEYLGIEGNAEHFRFRQQDGPISEVHFYIIPDKQQLKKMEYSYRTGQLARIQFHVFRNDVAFEPETFAESNYVTIEKKSIRPSRYFQHFQMVDLTRH
jgi:hypothetical protein